MTDRSAASMAGQRRSAGSVSTSAQAQRAKLRVAFVTETYPPEVNGVAITARHTVRFLGERGHRVELVRPHQRLAAAPDPHIGEVLVPGMPLPLYRGIRFGLPARRMLEKRWRTDTPDIVHIATEGPLGWSALQAARACGIPVTSDYRTHFHRYSAHYHLGWLEHAIDSYLRAFHNRTRATFVATRALAAELAARSYHNCTVVGRGVDTTLFHPQRRNRLVREQWGAGEADPVFIHVGRLAAEKNLDLAVRTFERVRAEHPRARMVWVGDGPLRARMERAHPDHVFCGTITGAGLAALYASGDVFLFPSLTDTFGNVTLEALASGLAVVAFQYGAAEETCENGRHACLARLGDEDAFTRAALQLAGMPAMLARIRTAAPRAVAHLAWPTVLLHFERQLIACARDRHSVHRDATA